MKIKLIKNQNNKIPLKEKLKDPNFSRKVKDETWRVIATIIFTFIYGIGMSWFIEMSTIRLYSGGMPGMAQIIIDFSRLFGETIYKARKYVMAGLVIVLNIPIFLLGWFGVSKKFTIYSLISVFVQSTVLSFISIDVFKELDSMIQTIIGGILMGIGVGGTLKFGGSTGGFDIVAQFVSHRTGKSVGFVSTVLNVSIALVGCFINGIYIFKHPDPKIAASALSQAYKIAGSVLSYTALRLIITMIVTDRIHTSYKFFEVNIISEFPIELTEAIILGIGRGVTLFDVRGGYGYHDRQMMYLIIFSHERRALEEIIDEIDSHAFVVYKQVERIKGNFKKKYIS